MLGERECAAVTLWDCPVILVAGPNPFEFHVHASYAPCLLASIDDSRAFTTRQK